MTEINPDKTVNKYGLLLTLIFFVIMVFWTLFFLFVIPEIQKKYLITGVSEFIEFQSGTGFFTIFGYFCFVLLIVTWFAVLFTPGYNKTKGLWIFISILIIFSLMAIGESLYAYSYLTKDGAVIRHFISTGEKRFSWNDVKKVEISFYNTSAKPKGSRADRMMKLIIIFDRSYDIVLKESASGNSDVLTEVFRMIKNKPPLEIDDDDRDEWEQFRKDHAAEHGL